MAKLTRLAPLSLALFPLLLAAQTPYPGTAPALPAQPALLVQAESFDNGGEGLAYHDTTKGNAGGKLRATDVDLEPTTDVGGGYDVGWIDPGEWLGYTVTVPVSASYAVELRVAAAGPGGTLHLESGGQNLTGPLTIPDTGGWQNWTTLRATAALVGGPQQLRLVFDTAGTVVGNVNWLRFTVLPPTMSAAVPITPTPTPTPIPLPTPAPPVASGGAHTYTVQAGGDLQAVLNMAANGDTVLLQAGATFTGHYQLPAKSGTGTLTVTSSSGVPAAGVRMTPATAVTLAKIQAPPGGPAVLALTGATHVALVGLEFLPNLPNADGTYFTDTIDVGDPNPTALANLPDDIVIDRCYIHAADSGGQRRGIALNGGAATVTNSHISGFRDHNGDSQAIQMASGPGPYIVTNNYLEAASENILIGGSDPQIPNLVPGQSGGIVIRGNYFAKPLAWKGQGWTVKNLLEVKNGTNILIDGNLLEHSWQEAQSGWGLLLTVRNQDGHCPWCSIQHLEARYNVIRDTEGAGIGLDAWDYRAGIASVHGLDINLHDNLLLDTGNGFWSDRPFALTSIRHNTVFGTARTPTGLLLLNVPYPTPSQLTYQDNVTLAGPCGITSVGGCGYGSAGFFAQAADGTFDHNAIETNVSPFTFAGVNYTLAAGTLATRLGASFVYSGLEASSDGKPLGADVAAIKARIPWLVLP